MQAQAGARPQLLADVVIPSAPPGPMWKLTRANKYIFALALHVVLSPPNLPTCPADGSAYVTEPGT